MSKFTFTLEGYAGDPFMPSKPHVPKFSPLGFMGLVYESITYIFSNKINYLVRLEVLVMPSLSCDQNLERKDVYCPLAFRCQPLVLFTLELANLVWELGCFLRQPPAEGRIE